MPFIRKKIETWFADFTAVVYDRKYITLFLMLVVTFALAGQMTKLKIDTRDESFFNDDDPALVAYNTFRDTFGQDDMFIIGMKPEHGLSVDFFATLNQFHHELEDSVPYLDEITSLINGRIVRAEGDTLIVEDLMQKLPQTEADLKMVMELINRYPLYENLLVSKDRSITSIIIKAKAVKSLTEEELLAGFENDPALAPGNRTRYLSTEENVEIDTAIRKVAEKYQNQGIEFHFAGTPAFVAEIQRGIEKDLGLMIPLSFMMIIFFLSLLFRRISGVIYPLVTVFFSLLSSLGIMAAAGIPITNVIQILPTFLIVVGISDSVHILSIFYRIHNRINDKRQAIIEAMASAGLPVLMTSVTTACGLLSFAWADVASVAQLGCVAPVGVMLAFFYTVFLLPALIAIFPAKRKLVEDNKPANVDRLFEAIARTTVRRPILISLVSAVIVCIAAYGALSLRFSHNAMTWFPEDAQIRVSSELLDKVNGGTIMLEATIDTGSENGLHDPDLLNRLNEAAVFIPNLKINGIQASKATSIADVLKEINRALNEGRDAAYVVPESRQLAAQELILFESSGSDDLEDVADSGYQIGRLSILAPFTDAILYKDYIQRIKEYLDEQFADETVILTGHIPLFVQIIKNSITSMLQSYIFALVVITILMIMMVGSLRIGMMSMVANLAPIIGIFGIMGGLGIPLDLSTILIGSVVLGLVVDDTIHFLHHFRKAYDEKHDVEAAVRQTFFSTGRAMCITSLVLCGGFFIYMASYLVNNIRFGLLIGCAVLLALAADFILVPSLLSLVYRKKRDKVQDGAVEEAPMTFSYARSNEAEKRK